MPKYKPKFPKIVEAEGVDTSPLPREMPISTDESRYNTSKKTSGTPVTDYTGNSNPYIDYQSIDLLLSLQNPRSKAYDEMCFYIMGQVKEILFRGLHFELFNAREQIKEDQVNNSIEIINRATGYVKYLADSWSVLSTIKAEGFNEFRDYLGTASGQLSFMYRHVEFILGNKSIRMASAHKNVPHIWPEIEKSLHTPSLYDEVIFYLNREGYEISKDILKRDWSKRYKANSSVKDAWLAICKNPSTENKLFQLAESLITFEEHYAIYRWKHFILVKKMIGYKSGTGGSAGVGWLEKVTEHHFFPELWDIRNDF